MGLYPINCRECGHAFLWFSGNPDQRYATCQDMTTLEQRRRRLKARFMAMKRDLPKYEGPMRECELWDPYAPGKHLRWDVKWRDPASGWVSHYCVDARVMEGPDHEADREFCRKTARGCISREINRKMGTRAMINLTRDLPLFEFVLSRFV